MDMKVMQWTRLVVIVPNTRDNLAQPKLNLEDNI